MVKLECGAVNCVNNSDYLCALGSIDVGGGNTRNGDGTCCESFADEGSSFGNLVSGLNALPQTEVGCDAENCVYLNGHVCTAEYIKIGGGAAHRKQSTMCRSFTRAI